MVGHSCWEKRTVKSIRWSPVSERIPTTMERRRLWFVNRQRSPEHLSCFRRRTSYTNSPTTSTTRNWRLFSWVKYAKWQHSIVWVSPASTSSVDVHSLSVQVNLLLPYKVISPLPSRRWNLRLVVNIWLIHFFIHDRRLGSREMFCYFRNK